MRQGFIKVAAVTPEIKVADPAYNAQRICEKIDEATANGAKVIVFPELCITGYTCQDLFLQRTLLQDALTALYSIAEYTDGYDALIFVGLPLERLGKLYNVAAVINCGEIIAFVPKTAIPNYGEFYEVRHFTSGNQEAEMFRIDDLEVPFGTNILFQTDALPGLSIGCELCEDLWAPITPSTNHAIEGANIIVNLSASNETVGKDEYRESLVNSTSARLICGYIYASAGEGESTQDLVFGGHNLIAENGVMLARAERYSSETIYAEIDVHRLIHERRRMNTYPDTNHDYLIVDFAIVIEETKLSRVFAKTPFVPANQLLRDKRCEDILNIQAHGLKKRLTHTGVKDVVIGLSGGLDSTLALIVAVRAFDMLSLDRAGIHTVTMPCFGTTDRTYDNACALAKTFGTTLMEIDLKESVTKHFEDIGHDISVHDVTYENGQARERTQVLMNLANRFNGLVIGTGDMSELALGWATYNGDHMSMYGVNAGVPKTLVRHLTQYYADVCGDELLRDVLIDVLTTPVSPELLPPEDGQISQKTEDLVGPYELHDFFLYYLLRVGYEPAKIFRIACCTFADEYDEKTIMKWLKTFVRRFFTQQFKRSCLPDGPKVGSVAVSPRGDLRMPSDASYQSWMRQLEEIESYL